LGLAAVLALASWLGLLAALALSRVTHPALALCAAALVNAVAAALLAAAGRRALRPAGDAGG
jgi:hypothetical protein